MTISEFIKKWSRIQLTERSAAQQHFLELCELFGHPRPPTRLEMAHRKRDEVVCAAYGRGRASATRRFWRGSWR